jgi:tRNA(Ile2) C34 agmatinyltransferase TiaS
LKKEYAELVDRNKALEADLAKHLIPSDYVEQSGALFKRKPEGHGYDTTPRCPVCHSAMNSRLNIAIFECGSPKCGHRAGFSGAELGEVMDRLP